MRIKSVLYTSVFFVLIGMFAVGLGMSGTEAQEPTGTATPLCGVSMFTSDAAAQVAPDAQITFFVNLSNCGGWRVLANSVVVAEVLAPDQMEVTVSAASIGIGAFQFSLDVLVADGWVPSGFPGFDFAIDVAPEPPPYAHEDFYAVGWDGQEDAANGCTLSAFEVISDTNLTYRGVSDCLVTAIAVRTQETGKIVAFVQGSGTIELTIKALDLVEGHYDVAFFGQNGGGWMSADHWGFGLQISYVTQPAPAVPSATQTPAPVSTAQPEPLYQAPPTQPLWVAHFFVVAQQSLEGFFENLQLFE